MVRSYRGCQCTKSPDCCGSHHAHQNYDHHYHGCEPKICPTITYEPVYEEVTCHKPVYTTVCEYKPVYKTVCTMKPFTKTVCKYKKVVTYPEPEPQPTP